MPTSETLSRLVAAAHRQDDSSQRFSDGGQCRVEIPSVEGPDTFACVVEEATRLGVPLHRVSQGSGIALLTDAEISGYAELGAQHGIEVCLFVGPRAAWDGASAAALTPDGRNVGWRHVGLRSLSAGLDDVHRAAELGIRSVLIADEGLATLITEAKAAGTLPDEMVVKASALMGIANPVGAAALAQHGIHSLNIAGDTALADLAAFRAATTAFLDLYIEGPDGLGGFLRYHDIGEIVRLAAPVYLKFGLRNAPNIYPAGAHLPAVQASARERVRRALIGLEHLQRQRPGAAMSPTRRSDAGVPVCSTQARVPE